MATFLTLWVYTLLILAIIFTSLLQVSKSETERVFLATLALTFVAMAAMLSLHLAS